MLMCQKSGLPSILLSDRQLMITVGGIKDGKDTYAMKSVDYGISAGHGVSLSSCSKVYIAIIHTEMPLMIVLQQHYRVPHARVGRFDNIPIH